MALKLHTQWKYVGPGDGHGELHWLVLEDIGMITTAGMQRAWHGAKADFLHLFTPVSA